MFQTKRVSWVLLMLLAVCALLSCGESASNKAVTINFWHLDNKDNQVPVWQGIADDFMKAHPNVKIEVTYLENEAFKSKLATMMQSGTPPDLFRSWGGGVMNSYAEAGLLKDITEEFKNWPNKVGAVDVYSYKGKVYGLPYDMGCVGIWYNKDLLAKAGYDKFPETWSSLLECVKKLKAAGITPITLGEGDKWPGHFWWVYLAVRIGGKAAFDKAYSGEGSFADETWVKAGQKLQELIALQPFQKGFLADNHDQQEGLLGNGKAAMILMGQWAPGVSASQSLDKKGIGDKLAFANFPAVEGGAGQLTDCMGGGNGYILGKNAPAETVEFLKFITSLDVEKRIASSGSIDIIPTVSGAETALKDPNMQAVAKAVANAGYFQLYYDQYLPQAVANAVLDGTQGIFAGKITPEKCAQMVDEAFKKSK